MLAIRASLASVCFLSTNLCCACPACRKNVKDSNVNGEASILGGLLVVKAGEGGIAWMHAEKTFGEFPDTQDVIAAAKEALGAAQ